MENDENENAEDEDKSNADSESESADEMDPDYTCSFLNILKFKDDEQPNT